MRLETLLREPLVRFLAIGAILAGIYALVPDAPADAPSASEVGEAIVVTEGRIDQLRQLFERTWQRPPTGAELDGLIEAYVREEVLYRAGRALGLGEDDSVVRRRIAQKMAFLMEPAPGELEATGEALAEHLAAFPERFREPARLAFEQVFLDPAGRGEALEADLARVRAALEAGADPARLGDRTLLPAAVGMGPATNVARTFGEDFADALLEVPPGRWTGPVASPFGVHLVRVDRRVAARDPALAEVREAVRADWAAVRSREILEERLAEMTGRYRVVVERPEAGEPGARPASGEEEAAATSAAAGPAASARTAR